MTSFLSTVLQELLKQNRELSGLTFILPSKRAGSFLRKEISRTIASPVFSPEVASIEEFSEKISGLSTIDNTTTLFEFYAAYKELTPPQEAEDFENFSNWAQTLIHDFNEIDRYLIPPEQIFNYLSEIQDINHWSVASDKTDLVQNYLNFWKTLPQYYTRLKEKLLSQQKGYQGMIYRRAAENIDQFAVSNGPNYVFIGFNALNNAEQAIIQKMLEHNAEIFWDIDKAHFEDADHDAALFIKEYVASWPYYKTHDFQSISENYASPKNIEIIGIPKSIGQAKHVGEILSGFNREELNSTALILGDESLLLPVLNSLPDNIPALNITMGYPLKYSSFSSLFDRLFEFYKTADNNFYYKDVVSILSNPIVQLAIGSRCENVIAAIKKENLLYITQVQILGLFKDPVPSVIALIFPSQNTSPQDLIVNLIRLTEVLKLKLMETNNSLNLEFLYQYTKVITSLQDLLSKFSHIKSISSLHHFFKELTALQGLDFQGKPFEGLQLMGMLESRVLDFETVILTSVDEGILPAGKSTNSFIPYELKKSYGLPTHKEKDAVYTYHFYHLLQRAKRVYLLHNTDTESHMGGEKSRFLIQLEIEKQPYHSIKTSVVTPEVPAVSSRLQTIHKTPEVVDKIRHLAESGFSPSALTTYIRNPLDFYRQYILGIKDKEEVEETIAYNTLGTVVHDTLEAFYAPFQGHLLTLDHIKEFQSRIEAQVSTQFEKTYSKSPLSKGKNLLIFEVAKRYVTNFLKMEETEILAGKVCSIRSIETNLKIPFDVPELGFPVYLRGKVDRVDFKDGILRIIDYKTGKVLPNQLEITDWDLLTTDYDKYSKPFQVLMYASMLLDENNTRETVEAGVISFKNLKQGFLKFGEKQGTTRNKNCNIEEATLKNFKVQLKNLILEICNPEIPFLEKEINTAYGTY